MLELFNLCRDAGPLANGSFHMRSTEYARWQDLDLRIGDTLFSAYKFGDLTPELFALIKDEQGREGLLSAIQNYGKIGRWLDKPVFVFEEELENGISVFDTLDVKERCRAFFAHCLIGLMMSAEEMEEMPAEIQLFAIELEQSLHDLPCEQI